MLVWGPACRSAEAGSQVLPGIKGRTEGNQSTWEPWLALPLLSAKGGLRKVCGFAALASASGV